VRKLRLGCCNSGLVYDFEIASEIRIGSHWYSIRVSKVIPYQRSDTNPDTTDSLYPTSQCGHTTATEYEYETNIREYVCWSPYLFIFIFVEYEYWIPCSCSYSTNIRQKSHVHIRRIFANMNMNMNMSNIRPSLVLAVIDRRLI
jgi:hypothetical protein